MACSERTLEKFLQNLTYEKASKPDSLYKKPHTALVLSDNEVIDTVAAYMKKAALCSLWNVNYPEIPES